MRGKDFLKGLNHVEDELITEMETPVPVKKFNRNFFKFAAVAACIAVLTGAAAVSALEKKNGENMQKNGSRAGNLQETTQGEKESEAASAVDEPTSSSLQTQGGTVELTDYDITGDGVNDRITLRIPNDLAAEEIQAEITDGSSQKTIYQQKLSVVHENQKKIYLCEKGGERYLLEYVPYHRENSWNYSYTLSSFPNGEQVIMDSDNRDISFLTENLEEKREEIEQFFIELNSYLAESVLLVSTVDAVLKYSQPDALITNYSESCSALKQNNIFLILKEETLTADGAEFVIKNETDIGCSSGEYYRIEKLEEDGNIWVPLEYIREDVSWIEIGWEIESYSEWEFTADWKDIYGTLDSGRYRLMKVVNGEEVLCEFDIKDKIY